MKTIITVTICIGLLVVFGCQSNYTQTPTAEENVLVDLGPAPVQMIDTTENPGFDLWHSTYWQERNAEDEYWRRQLGY